jgi:hypothetical protein
MQDDALVFFDETSKIWTREEALAEIEHHEFIDLPESYLLHRSEEPPIDDDAIEASVVTTALKRWRHHLDSIQVCHKGNQIILGSHAQAMK